MEIKADIRYETGFIRNVNLVFGSVVFMLKDATLTVRRKFGVELSLLLTSKTNRGTAFGTL